MGKRGKTKRSGGGKKKLDADLDEEIDDYQPSGSEEEFGKDEKILLDNRRGTKKEDSEEEVFGVHSSSDDDDEEEEEEDKFYGGGVGSDMDSDIESKGSDDSEAGLPDSMAWGKKRNKYYNTDYVDQDFGGMSKEDEELAEMEEQEALNIQKRLLSHMEESDFTMGLLDKVKAKKEELAKKSNEGEASEKIIADLSQMTKNEKIQLLKLESPELFELIDDYIENMKLAKDKLLPVINLNKEGKLASCQALDFVHTLFSIILNYSTNIVFYLLLKSKRIGPVDNHPVVQRLYTYKKLLDEMHIVMEDQLMEQIDYIIESNSKNIRLEEISLDDKKELIAKNRAERRKRQLKIVEEAKRTEKMIEKKKAKLSAHRDNEVTGDAIDSDIEEETYAREEPVDSEDDEEMDDAKRAITYEMKKNKGLTPRRKKEDRNPRVKNKNKYRKAKIRRKGQVRDVRTEVDRYGGEVFGIKTHMSKSIKIKS